jgi:hypothetical protein
MQRGSLIDHQGVCPRAPVVCAAKDDGGCGWEGPRADQVEHEKTCVYGKAYALRVRMQVYVFTSTSRKSPSTHTKKDVKKP